MFIQCLLIDIFQILYDLRTNYLNVRTCCSAIITIFLIFKGMHFQQVHSNQYKTNTLRAIWSRLLDLKPNLNGVGIVFVGDFYFYKKRGGDKSEETCE